MGFIAPPPPLPVGAMGVALVSAEVAEMPPASDAATLKKYAWPFVRPGMVALVPVDDAVGVPLSAPALRPS
jgi:hypothetical protein